MRVTGRLMRLVRTTAILMLECRHYLHKSTVDVGGLSHR